MRINKNIIIVILVAVIFVMGVMMFTQKKTETVVVMPESGSEMMHDQHMKDGSMTMDEMSEMLEGKKGDELDKAFLEGMIEHHEGAVSMAEYILKDGKHEELRTMAQEIIDAQTTEIEMMKQWQKDWGYEK